RVAEEGRVVVHRGAEADPARRAYVEAAAERHRESRVRAFVRERKNRAGGLELGRAVRDAEERVREGRQARAIAPLDLRPGQEVEQPRVEPEVLRRSGAGRRRARLVEAALGALRVEVRGDVPLEAQILVDV